MFEVRKWITISDVAVHLEKTRKWEIVGLKRRRESAETLFIKTKARHSACARVVFKCVYGPHCLSKKYFKFQILRI